MKSNDELNLRVLDGVLGGQTLSEKEDEAKLEELKEKLAQETNPAIREYYRSEIEKLENQRTGRSHFY